MLNHANGYNTNRLKYKIVNFNPYIDKIDVNFWLELCAKEIIEETVQIGSRYNKRRIFQWLFRIVEQQ